MLNQSQSQNKLNTSSLADTWKSRPDEWQNDERMNALFAPFRNRDLNPLHYDAKLNFWKKSIISYASENGLLRINQKILEESFIRNGSKPKSLSIVLETLEKERKILTKHDFIKQQQQQQQGWVSYAFDKLVWSPFSWTTKYIVSTAATTLSGSNSNTSNTKNWVSLNSSSHDNSNNSNESQIDFVLIDQIDKKSIEIHEHLINQVTYPELDCLIDYEKFQQICLNQFNIENSEDIELILANLIGKKRAIVNDTLVKNKKLIKFSSTSSGSNLKISDLESNYYVLKQTELGIEKQINSLSRDIENLTKQIKELLKQKSQQQAMNLLKKRKKLEKTLDLKHQNLDNIHQLILNMQSVDTNKMAINVYKKTLDTMKNVNKEFDLDKVDDLIFDIQDNMKLSNEIETTLSKSVLSNNEINEDELEDELNDLIKQKQVNKTENDVEKDLSRLSIDDLLNDLPEIPNDSFSSLKSPIKTTTAHN